jgi:hypothetical protein
MFTIIFEAVLFHAQAKFSGLLIFLKASWNISVTTFSIACDSASTIAIVSKWRYF